ncbi:MAG: hypothetical protein WKF82_08480 [Nocardioidaceae bacterium]
MNMYDELAKEMVRERVARRVHTQRPAHPRTAKVLRRLADRFDGLT